MKSRYSLASLVSFCAIALLIPNQGLSQTLQDVLDSCGYDYIDVIEDETGIESFPLVPGEIYHAEVLAEYSDSYPGFMGFGWYTGEPGTPTMTWLFDVSVSPGDSVDFAVEGGDTLGFYMAWPYDEWMSPFFHWYTEAAQNILDSCDHALVFETGEPGEYIIAWEDEPYLGNGDFQDLVMLVTVPAAEDPPEPQDPPDPPEPDEIVVEIDIKPGDYPNAINPTSGRGVISVVIFGSADCPAGEIDPSTLALGGSPYGTAGEPGLGGRDDRVVDVDGDGLDDLFVKFPHSQDGIVYGDVEGIVTGETYGGIPIVGADSVKTVGRKKPKPPKPPKPPKK